MKKIGIIGGLSPESTILYYKDLNVGVRERTNYKHQAKIFIASVDGGEIWALRQANDWEGQGKVIANAALSLEAAGVDFIVLAANTLHKMAHCIENVISVPFIHIIDETAKRIKLSNIDTIGLTGTSFTMTERFYIDRLATHGIKTIIPTESEIIELDRIIYKELCWGNVIEESKQTYNQIINNLIKKGAQGAILGCTELTLFTPLNCSVPLFDTTQIHIESILDAVFL